MASYTFHLYIYYGWRVFWLTVSSTAEIYWGHLANSIWSSKLKYGGRIFNNYRLSVVDTHIAWCNSISMKGTWNEPSAHAWYKHWVAYTGLVLDLFQCTREKEGEPGIQHHMSDKGPIYKGSGSWKFRVGEPYFQVLQFNVDGRYADWSLKASNSCVWLGGPIRNQRLPLFMTSC